MYIVKGWCTWFILFVVRWSPQLVMQLDVLFLSFWHQEGASKLLGVLDLSDRALSIIACIELL